MIIKAKKLPYRCMCTSYEVEDTGGAWMLKNASLSKAEFEEALKQMFNAEIHHMDTKGNLTGIDKREEIKNG